MTRFPQLWIVLRALVVLLISSGIALYNPSRANLDWFACLLISIAGGLFLFIWLLSIRDRPNIDWTNPISITLPFFPMNRYPMRYWLVVAVSLILGGSVAFFRETIRGGQYTPFGATFIALGLAIIIAVGARIRRR